MHPKAKKIVRVTGWVFGGLLLVLCLAVAGALIWLRTGFGERTVAGIATKALADQGLFLTMDEFSGPLPSRLLLKNVRLADSDGEWFAAKELEVVLTLGDLLRKTVTVSLARVATPQVFRLPKLLPTPAAETPTAPKYPSPGYFNLPVAVRLDNFAIENLDVFTPLVFPDTAGTGTADTSPLFRASAHGNAKAGAGEALTATVSLEAAVADMDALASRTGPLPVTGFAMTAEVDATIGATIAATVNGSLDPTTDGEQYTLAYTVDAGLDGMNAALRAFSLDGLGMRLNAKGGVDLDPLVVRADATLRTENGGAWEQLVARMSGQTMGGAVNADIKATLEANKTVSAVAEVSGTAMRWDMDQVQKILGPNFSVKAEASGSEATAFALNLKTLEAGSVSASGNASFAPETKKFTAALQAVLANLAPVAPGVDGALHAKLDASGTPEAPAAVFEITSDAIRHPAVSITKLLATGTLSGTLAAPVAVARVSAETVNAEGAALKTVRAEAKLSGTRTAPVFSLEATSAGITTQAGEFKTFRAGVDGRATVPDKADKAVEATVDITLGSSPAGPVALRTALAAAQKTNGAVTARLHGIDLSLAGTDLMADITATIPASTGGAAPMPSVTGKAHAKIADWKPIAALSGVAVSGSKAELDATFSHDTSVQQMHATLKADALTMPDAFSISALSGSLEARNLASPDIILSLTLGKGKAGPVDWQSGAVAVNARKGNGTFAVALRTDKSASAAIPAAAKNPPAQPGKSERLTTAGSFSLSPVTVTLDRLAARMPDSPLGIYLTEPATAALGTETTVRNLRLAVVPGKGSITMDAALGGAKADLTATITELPFRLLREISGAPLPDGDISAEAVLKKTGGTIQGKLDARAVVTAPAVGKTKTPPVAFTLASTLDGRPDENFPNLKSGGGITRLKGNLTVGFSGQGSVDAPGRTPSNAPDAKINFNVPLRFAANGVPTPAMNAPLGANVAWRGEIAPLWALVPMQDRNLSGLAQVDAEVKGRMDTPEYTVNAYLANGRFEDHIYGVLLSKIALEASSTSSGASKLLMRAEDGAGGYVALEGDLSSPDQADGQSSAAPRLSARGQINHLQPLHRDDIFLRLSGRLAVDGPLDAMNIAADIGVERGELSIANLGGSVRTLEITDPSATRKEPSPGPKLDVKVSIPHRFYIRGRGLDSEWEGTLAVTGSASDPSLTGSLKPVRGTFDLMSRDFAFSGGDISFFGGDRIDPGLNLELTYGGPNITAVVKATGTASKPHIAMESRPPLPQDQIMAEVLFGKEFSKLSRFESLQVANSLRQLANIGGDGLDPLATMRTKLGIDMLRVGSTDGQKSTDNRSVSGAPAASTVSGTPSSSGGDDSSSTPTLEAGKYINDAIYIGVEQGATSDSTGVRVEVELRPNLSLQGKTSSNSSQIGLGWKRDY